MQLLWLRDCLDARISAAPARCAAGRCRMRLRWRELASWLARGWPVLSAYGSIQSMLNTARVTTLLVNGVERAVDAGPERSLLSVLREDLDLTGAKYGCGEAQ